MKIRFMRGMDFWVGVPLCFFLSVVHSIGRLFTFQSSSDGFPRKILFIKPSEIGGIILAHPLMCRVQRNNPDAQMFFLTFKGNEDILKVLGCIPLKQIWTIRDTSLIAFIDDTFKVIREIRKARIDIVIDLEFFSRFTAIMSYLSGAAKRIGFYRYTMEGLYRGELLTHKVLYNSRNHMMDVYCAMADVVHMSHKQTPECEYAPLDREKDLPRYRPDKCLLDKMEDQLSNLGVISGSTIYLMNPGEGKIPLREWPIQNFQRLCQDLLKRENAYIIMVGEKEGSRKAKEVQNYFRGEKRIIDLTGKTTVEEYLCLCSVAHALIANDSGVAHLGSLTPIKQFVLFGPESPEVFSPLGGHTETLYAHLPCSPCLSVYNHRTTTCRDNQCLKKIDPESVLNMITRHVNKKVEDRIMF